MWRTREVKLVAVSLLTMIVLAGPILAHSLHSFHIHKHAKAVADVADEFTLRTNSPAALLSAEFKLPSPVHIPESLLIHEAIPYVSSTSIEVSGSRAPPRES